MQRKLLGALVSSISVTVLLLALMPVMALGQSENCPAGYDHKSDPPKNITVEWGTATLVNSNSAVEFYVKDGYTVKVCVKGGNQGFAEDTIVGEDTVTVATPTDQDVSHYEWTASTPSTTTTPEETTTTVDDSTTTVPEESTTTEPTTTTVAPTTTTTVAGTSSSEATTTTIEATTSSEATTDSTLPFTGSETGDWAAVGASVLLLGGLALLVARTRHFDT